MDGLGDHIFSRARFSRDQHASIRRSDALEPVDDGLHAFAGVNQVFETESLIRRLAIVRFDILTEPIRLPFDAAT